MEQERLELEGEQAAAPAEVKGEPEEAEGELGGLTGNYHRENIHNFEYHIGEYYSFPLASVMGLDHCN